MSSQNKQAKRRLKQLGATLNPSRAGWSDSEEEDLIQESKLSKKKTTFNIAYTKKLFAAMK